MSDIGSHGGEDHFVITDAVEVDRLLARDVAEVDREAFRTELGAAASYERKPKLRARIHLAMLFLADGDLDRLRSARALADIDWRDLLVQAEYPSTPAYGTKETRQEKTDRQGRDIATFASWRNRGADPLDEGSRQESR